jgi:hypothetical protein
MELDFEALLVSLIKKVILDFKLVLGIILVLFLLFFLINFERQNKEHYIAYYHSILFPYESISNILSPITESKDPIKIAEVLNLNQIEKDKIANIEIEKVKQITENVSYNKCLFKIDILLKVRDDSLGKKIIQRISNYIEQNDFFRVEREMQKEIVQANLHSIDSTIFKLNIMEKDVHQNIINSKNNNSELGTIYISMENLYKNQAELKLKLSQFEKGFDLISSSSLTKRSVLKYSELVVTSIFLGLLLYFGLLYFNYLRKKL